MFNFKELLAKFISVALHWLGIRLAKIAAVALLYFGIKLAFLLKIFLVTHLSETFNIAMPFVILLFGLICVLSFIVFYWLIFRRPNSCSFILPPVLWERFCAMFIVLGLCITASIFALNQINISTTAGTFGPYVIALGCWQAGSIEKIQQEMRVR